MKPIMMNVASQGAFAAIPPNLAISLVPVLCWITPQTMKRTAVMRPCENIWNAPAAIPIVPSVAKPNSTMPMWLIDEKATIFFRSFWAKEANAP
jgi:hypothetical protein